MTTSTFGQPTTHNVSGGGFGNSPTTAPATSTGATSTGNFAFNNGVTFGTAAPPPARGFGLFGHAPAPSAGSRGDFDSSSSLFGTSSGSLFCAPFAPFGTPAPAPSPFGTAAPAPGFFGTAAPRSDLYADPAPASFGSFAPTGLLRAPAPATTHTAFESIHEHYAMLLKTGDFSDITFVTQGQEFKAHKVILHRNTKFASLLADSTNNRLDMTDVSPQAFGKLLEFIYTGSVAEVGIDDVNVIKYSVAYDLPGLKDLVFEKMKSKVVHAVSSGQDVDNVMTILGNAIENDADDLREFALCAICTHKELFKESAKACTNERARTAVYHYLLDH